MQKRRNFVKLAFVSTLAFGASQATSQPIVPSVKNLDQSEFLFWANDSERSAARKTAEFIVSQLDSTPLDAPRLRGIYGQGSAALKERYSEADFIQRMLSTRAPLGNAKERVLHGIDGGFRKLPNIAEGEYLIVAFSTNFQGTPDIYTEQVTLGRNGGTNSAWQFVEYYVAKKPYYSY